MLSIPITRPAIGDAEIEAVASVLRSGFLVQGPQVEEFERLVAEATECEHAVALSNCTAALRVALLSQGIGPGDRVAVTSYSWVATANVIELVGATPVFVDVDESTFNMGLHELEKLLASDTDIRAVMAVDTFGNPAGMAELEALASDAGVWLIEDAACALGAYEYGRPAGSFGLAGCFSFHPRKIITTGEGGMLVTNDERVASIARRHRNHGLGSTDGGVPVFVDPGDNLRMTDFQGALGVTQMGKLDGLVDQRSVLARRYDQLVRELGCRPQSRSPQAAVQSYVVVVPQDVTAVDAIQSLRNQGVEATIGTNAIPFTPYFLRTYGAADEQFPNTALLRDHAITLPLFPGMTDDEQDRVVQALARAVGVE
jgi:dTDP-4-amino-4,6-dideoxygalactose transaminase